MSRRRKSPSRLCIGLLFVFFALAFLLPAVKEGSDARLWILAAGIPGALLVFGLPFMSRLLSLDRLLSVIALALCAAGILALVPEAPDESFSQMLVCVGALILMVTGSLSIRILRPVLVTSLISGALALGLCAAPLLTDSVSCRVSYLSLPLLLIAFVSLLSGRNQLPAMLLALAGMALLLVQGPVTALIWGITFLLLFWAYAGHPAILIAGIAAACVLVSASRFLFPDLFAPVNSSVSVSPVIRTGLFGPASFGELPVSRSISTDSVFPLLVGRYGWILSASLILFYPAILMRGSSLAHASRRRFHGLIAMGAVLLIVLHAAGALLFEAGIVSAQQIDLPGLSRDFPSLGVFMFLIGMLGGISARNRLDLEEDTHLAMLAG